MSLLEDLWGGARGSNGRADSRQASGSLVTEKKALRRQDLSYVQVVASSSSGEQKTKVTPGMTSDTAASRRKELSGDEWVLVQNRKKKKSISSRKDLGIGNALAGNKCP